MEHRPRRDNSKGQALFDDVWSAPVTVGLLQQDVDGHQVWAQTLVWVFDSSRQHAEFFVEGADTCHPPASPTGPEKRCECGESGAVLPLGQVWAMTWRRRRSPPR